MTTFTTSKGSKYIIEDGGITRLAEHPINRAEGLFLKGHPCEVIRLTVGQTAKIRLVGLPNLRTSVVTEIRED